VLGHESLERRACPAAFSLELPTTPIVEGDRATFTVRMAAPSTFPQRVAVSAISGSATLGNDFIFSNATQLLFSPGQTVKTFSVQTFTDSISERSETFRITATPLNVPNAATISAQATIYDLVATTVTAGNVRVTEGNAGTVNATFTVTLGGQPILPVTVLYSTRDVTATAGSDYAATSGSVVFRPGETTKTVTVSVTGDTIAEFDETYQVLLSSPTRGCTVTTPTLTGTIVNDEIDTPGFQITVVFTSPVTASQQAAFNAAAARWSQVITGDLPGVTLPSGTFIDDVRIDASIVAIDGVGGVLGQAGPTALRPGLGGLPYTGGMEFDSADVAAMQSGNTFQSVIMHEMGHVLGIGTLWSALGLVTGAGGSDPVFTGINAVREYNAIFGVSGTSVPVENTGGPGTRDSHWRETTMRTELMTGFAEPAGVAMPISRITVGSLADIGYTVNYSAADAFARPPLMAPGPAGGLGVALPVVTPIHPTPTAPSTGSPTGPVTNRPRPGEPRGGGFPSTPSPSAPAGPRTTSTGPRSTTGAPRTTSTYPRTTTAAVPAEVWKSLGSGR
jgi:hypothetical protein